MRRVTLGVAWLASVQRTHTAEPGKGGGHDDPYPKGHTRALWDVK